jgi:uncharacterized protein (TIRG00374 family)
VNRPSRFVLYVLTAAFAIWCVLSFRDDLAGLSLAPLLQSWDLVVLAVLLSLTNYALRITRWRSYLARLGHALPLRFTALTYTAGFAYTLLPGKLGEMVRARYYLPLGVPLPSVTAAFFAERLMDVAAMTVLAGLLLASLSRYHYVVLAAIILVAFVLGSLAVLPLAGITASLRANSRVPELVRNALAGLTSALASTRPLLSPQLLIVGFLLGLCAWGLEGVGLGVLCGIASPAPHVSLQTAAGIYAIAVLIGALSFLPGGLGSTEAVMTGLLVTQGYSVAQGLLITLACRLVTLWLAVGLGWLAIAALRQRISATVPPWR